MSLENKYLPTVHLQSSPLSPYATTPQMVSMSANTYETSSSTVKGLSVSNETSSPDNTCDPPMVSNNPPLGSNDTSRVENNLVLISTARLRELELLEKRLPKMIEEAIQENKKKNLQRLHEKDKRNPESVNIRVKRYALKHKETLNARRRAKREKQKKALEENSVQTLSANVSAPPSPPCPFIAILPNPITVRFDD